MSDKNNLKVAGKTATLGPHDLSRIQAARRKRERRRLRNALIEARNGNPPEGVWQRGDDFMAECSRCGCDYVICYDVGYFDPDMNLCGGSDRCTP